MYRRGHCSTRIGQYAGCMFLQQPFNGGVIQIAELLRLSLSQKRFCFRQRLTLQRLKQVVQRSATHPSHHHRRLPPHRPRRNECQRQRCGSLLPRMAIRSVVRYNRRSGLTTAAVQSAIKVWSASWLNECERSAAAVTSSSVLPNASADWISTGLPVLAPLASIQKGRIRTTAMGFPDGHCSLFVG